MRTGSLLRRWQVINLRVVLSGRLSRTCLTVLLCLGTMSPRCPVSGVTACFRRISDISMTRKARPNSSPLLLSLQVIGRTVSRTEIVLCRLI